MVRRKEYRIPSSDGKHSLFVRVWEPESAPRATLQIEHGVAEHSARYDGFACFMVEHGFAVAADDHLGHGQTAENESELIFFSEHDGWRLAVDDIEKLRLDVAAKYPGLPHFALGHSMGSFLLRTHLIRYPRSFDAAVISGTGQQSPLTIKAGRFIAKREAKKCGLRGRSALVQKLAFGSYNKGFSPVRTKFDWLTRDNAVVDAYIADPLCGVPASVGLFLDMLDGLQFIGSRENIAKMDKNTPLLFIAGEKDPVGAGGKQVKAVYEAFKQAGCRDVDIALYPECRHELLNELNKAEVYERVLTFFTDRIK